MKHISKQLLEKSQEAIILALETYNKPTIKYRIEGFCFFFSNAWELMLKAKIIEDNKSEGSIYYKKVKGQLRKSLSLRDCLKKRFVNENDPIRTNIETIADIRDSATHFIIEELESVYSGLFQAGILNYVDKLNEWFDSCITDKCSPALMTLVGDTKDIDPIKIKKKYGPTILEFVEAQMTELNKREIKIGNSKFRIPVEYKLVLTKVEGVADIKLTASTDGAKSALVVEVAKNPNKTHPNLMKHILTKVTKKTKIKFTQYDFQAVLALEKIKGNGKYHFEMDDPVIHRYSDDLVELIANKLEANGQYLENNKKKYGEFKKQRRKKPNR
jgi:EC042_2821-lke REase/Protein of unknown function (DUF3644)